MSNKPGPRSGSTAAPCASCGRAATVQKIGTTFVAFCDDEACPDLREGTGPTRERAIGDWNMKEPAPARAGQRTIARA